MGLQGIERVHLSGLHAVEKLVEAQVRGMDEFSASTALPSPHRLRGQNGQVETADGGSQPSDGLRAAASDLVSGKPQWRPKNLGRLGGGPYRQRFNGEKNLPRGDALEVESVHSDRYYVCRRTLECD